MVVRRALCILACIAAIAGCLSRSRPDPVPVDGTGTPTQAQQFPYLVVPSANLAFAPIVPSSTECPHASSARSGRVGAAARTYEGLTAVASIDDASRPGGAPRFIDIPPRGGGLVLERPDATGGTYEVRSATGAYAFNRLLHNAHVLAHDGELYASGMGMSWTGTFDSVTYGPVVNAVGELLACAVNGDDVRSLVVNNGLPSNERPTGPDYTIARLERPHNANILRAMGWEYTVDEVAVGAIDGSSQTVVALPSGRLVVLSPEGDPKTTRGIIVLDAEIDKGATDLSVVPPFAIVLYGGGDAGALVLRRSGDATATRVDARKADGSLAWRASLPFDATPPALDGNDRVYLVGKGIAAVDMTGHTLWSVASAVQLRAAAFADGTLAVVRGRDVQIVGRDGAIRQSFRAAEELTTYPAIAADGTVWVASAKSLYALR